MRKEQTSKRQGKTQQVLTNYYVAPGNERTALPQAAYYLLPGGVQLLVATNFSVSFSF